MLPMSARVRPSRSASTPNTIPPAAPASWPMEASRPPVDLLIVKSFIRYARTIE